MSAPTGQAHCVGSPLPTCRPGDQRHLALDSTSHRMPPGGESPCARSVRATGDHDDLREDGRMLIGGELTRCRGAAFEDAAGGGDRLSFSVGGASVARREKSRMSAIRRRGVRTGAECLSGEPGGRAIRSGALFDGVDRDPPWSPERASAPRRYRAASNVVAGPPGATERQIGANRARCGRGGLHRTRRRCAPDGYVRVEVPDDAFLLGVAVEPDDRAQPPGRGGVGLVIVIEVAGKVTRCRRGGPRRGDGCVATIRR